MKKRILGRILAVVFCVMAMSATLLTLTACDDKVGEFYYHIQDDNTVQVYVEQYDMEELIVPDTIAGLRVTSIKEPKKTQKVNTTLTTVVLPETLRTIEMSAFRGCSALENINFPKYLTKIEAYAFENCSVLETVRLPQGLVSIDGSAFSNCISLKNVYIPRSVTNIGASAFSFKSSPDLQIWVEISESEKPPYNFFTGGWANDWVSGTGEIHWNYNGYND